MLASILSWNSPANRGQGDPSSDRSGPGIGGRLSAVAVAVIVALLAMMFTAVPAANAAPGGQGALQISKQVNQGAQATIKPGDEITFSIEVSCDDSDCLAAESLDTIPAEFAGFQITDSSISPSSQPSDFSLEGCSTVVTTDCAIHAVFRENTSDGGVGIIAGHGYRMSLTLKAPQDLPATWPYNGKPIVNTVSATASNAERVEASATTTVVIETKVAVDGSKSWQPASQQFLPGDASTITLGVTNTSNVDAAQLAITDPRSATNGQAALGSDNPFDIVDFSGFGDVTFPTGATQVQVDAYVLDPETNTWSWVTGAPAGSAALPDGVVASAVGGIRVTFTGQDSAAVIPASAGGSVALNVVQRETKRGTGASLISGATVTNAAEVAVTVPDHDTVTATKTAPFAVGALDVKVEANKVIKPSNVPAGVQAVATLTAKNASNGPLQTLTISDKDFFSEQVQFNGFTKPLGYPAGATAGSVVWYFTDGTSSAPVPFAAGTTPTAPAGKTVSGFDVVYTGAIQPGVTVEVSAGVLPTIDLVTKADPQKALSNSVTVEGKNAAGTADQSKTAPLNVFYPDIDLKINKKISPSGAVTPGGTVVAQLETTTGTDSAFVNPNSIVVEDSWRSDNPDDFWNAYNPVAIAPTQVLSGSILTVEYLAADGTWKTLTTVDATAGTQVYSGDIPAELVNTIQGLRFTYTDANGFSQGTTVTPNIVFEARSTLRDDPSTTTAVAGSQTASRYENLGVAHGKGSVTGLPNIESHEVEDTADGQIRSDQGVGTTGAAKNWYQPGTTTRLSILSSQSGDFADTRLGWAVTATGYSSVIVSDPAGGEASPEDTVFQAFDLHQIRPISYSADPNLNWDSISKVWLYYNGAWNEVAAPATGWMDASGFVGYQLTDDEIRDTTGVRFEIVPNDAARAASTNPLRPRPGSGVATSTFDSTRAITLNWQLRNLVRVTGHGVANTDPWVSAKHGYNDPAPATVWNTVAVGGTRNGAAVTEATNSASVSLVDQTPAVKLVKDVTPKTVAIPNPKDVAPQDYPDVTFTLTATNDSSSRASYLRVTDPLLCGTADVEACVTGATNQGANPYTGIEYLPVNPFERLTVTSLTFATPAADEVDRDASQVLLWVRDAQGAVNTRQLSVNEAEALTADELTDVIGVSAVFQGTDPAQTGGTIKLGSTATITIVTKVRDTVRSNPDTYVTPFEIDNTAIAQSYDPVLYSTGQASTPNAAATTTVTLVDGVLDVAPTKTITPGSMLERDRATPIGVTLAATQGDATVAAQQVELADVDAEFWNNVSLSDTAAVTATMPAGADTMRVDVQTGSSEWISGPEGTTAVLPDVAHNTVTGIRVVFWNSAGTVFSESAPPANWSANLAFTVLLRDTLRDSGEPVPFPSTVDNEFTATASRTTVDPDLYPAVSEKAADDIVLDPGTFRLDVAKSPAGNNHTVEAGDPNSWTITFTNAGTGYLTIDKLVDTLPTSLSWNGDAPTFVRSTGGILGINPAFDYSKADRTLTLTWPEGSQRMKPGEKFTITVPLTLEPGLSAADRATNTVVVSTGQTLSACLNTSGNGQGTLTGTAPTDCGTTNYVQPRPGGSLVASKWVSGDIDGTLVSGATNVQNPAAECFDDGEGFYRLPCAANTVIGGTDEWKVNAVNSGTVGYSKLTFVDPLPVAGDRMLATGSSRASTYRPIFEQGFGVQVATIDGATVSYEVTTAAAVCVGTASGSAWPTDPTCAQHPAASEWFASSAFQGDWSAVTALRITVDYTATAGGQLAPGGSAVVKYHTVNAPATADHADRAPVTVPVTGAVAWNQAGVVASLVDGSSQRRAPVQAGVTIQTGALQIEKAITGAAAGYAGDSFSVSVVCEAGGQPLALGSAATLTLNRANGFTSSIGGIPVGGDCTFSEAGLLGSYGESGRIGDGVNLVVNQPSTTLAVPAAQKAIITNDYGYGSLVIRKTVATEATVGSFGPFDFALSCSTSTGLPVVLNASDVTFSIEAGQEHTVTADTIPLNSVCELRETGKDGAASVTISGTVPVVDGGEEPPVDGENPGEENPEVPVEPAVTSVTDNGDGTASIDVTAASDVTVVNHYEAGTLSLQKVVTGDGAETYGDGPFFASVVCSYGTPEAVVFSQDGIQIFADRAVLLDPVLPAGTECAVTETSFGGATSHIDPAAVVIVGPTADEAEQGATIGAVTAVVTNDFAVGSISVIKERTGDGVADFGAGPFTAQVVCTWQSNGDTLTVPLADAGILTLSEDNDYRAGIDGILVGANCVVTETDAGLAVATTYSPENGTVTVLDPSETDEVATVTITNRFDIGSLSISKVATAATVLAGDRVNYTITVANTGQIEAKSLTVTDVLPAGASFVSASDSGAHSAGTITWTIASLPVGASKELSVVVTYAAIGSYVNHASVVTPDGPWHPTTVVNGCDAQPVAGTATACATVSVAALASTGFGAVGFGAIALLLIVLGGIAMMVIRRRETSQL